MQETYFYLCQEYNDPHLGRTVIDWVKYGPFSVTTNRIGTTVYRSIGQGKIAPEAYIKHIMKSYPLVLLYGRAIRDRNTLSGRRPLPR